MNRSDSIDDYLAGQPLAVRQVLERVRAAIQKAVPRAEEAISYGMPAFRLDGRVLVYFAGWKQHWGLYPASPAAVEAFAAELGAYELSKGTVRFPLTRPVPVGLIQRIAKFRAKELAERAAAKRPARRERSSPRRQASPEQLEPTAAMWTIRPLAAADAPAFRADPAPHVPRPPGSVRDRSRGVGRPPARADLRPARRPPGARERRLRRVRRGHPGRPRRLPARAAAGSAGTRRSCTRCTWRPRRAAMASAGG